MAQRHEVEAWVNPDAWDNQEAAARAVDAIMETGSDDGDVWAALVRREEGETLDSLGRARTLARQEAKQATAHVRGMTILAVSEGVPEAEAARRAQVDRMTVRRWLGKR